MSVIDVVVGRVRRPHGLAGDLVVEVRTDDPDGRFAPGSCVAAELTSVVGKGTSRATGLGQRHPVRAGDPGPRSRTAPARRSLTIRSVRPYDGGLVVHVEGVEDRTAAEALQGAWLWATADDTAAPDDPGAYYDHQLIGLTAVSTTGERLGEVSDVLHPSLQDVLVIATPYGEALVPFVDALVPDVDLTARRVVIDPIPGLLNGAGEEAR